MNEHAAHIEALLFALGRPLAKDELEQKLKLSAPELEAALGELRSQQGRGIVLVDDGHTVELRTAATTASLIEQVRKDEYARDIGRAGLEALSAILYRGPLTRSEIDFIRGVNSSQTLRTLTMRGLVRKMPNPKDERSFLYGATTELLAELGVSDARDLPDFADVRQKLEALEAAYRTREASAQEPLS